MDHFRRLTSIGTTRVWSIASLSLLLALLAGASLRAQNPAYAFASSIGSTGRDHSNAIAIDGSENIYVTGSFLGTVDFDPGTGTASLTSASSLSDIFVASYDASGDYRWAFRLGSTGASENEGLSVAVDGSGNVVTSGTIQGIADFDPGTGTANRGSSGAKLTYVARYSSSGSYLWAFTLGGAGWSRVAVDGSNNVIVSGSFFGSFDFNPGSGKATLASTKSGGRYTNDIFVAKYSSSGSYLWAFKVGGTNVEGANAVAVDGSGNICVTGFFTGTVDFNPATANANLTSAGGSDIFVARYSSSGAYTWAFRVGGTGDNEGGNALAADSSGNVVVTGHFRGTVDFNPGTGTADLGAIGTELNMFIAQYSSSGAYLWAFNPSPGNGNGLTADGSGDVYVTGSISNVSNDFDPGSGTASLTGPCAFVASYTSSGALIWVFSIPAPAAGRGIAADGNGDVYVTGNFGTSTSTTVDFDPSEATADLTTAGQSDIFVAKYTESTQAKRSTSLRTSNEANPVALHVAPNPFTGAFTLYHVEAAPARIEIIDVMGRVVQTRDVDGATEVTLGAELPAGGYLVRITQGETSRQVMVRKVR